MKVRSYLFVGAVVAGFGLFTLAVQAGVKGRTVKPKPQTVEVDPYAPVSAASVTSQPVLDPVEQEKQRAAEAYSRWQATGTASELEKELIEKYVGFRDESGGGALDATGGPDTFGYRWKDNQAPDTATYAWIELRGDPGATWINTWSGTHDDSYSPSRYPIGFTFPFYGANQDSFRVCTNGFVQFTTTSTSLSNACLPSTGVAGPAIFPYWDDLHLDRGGNATGTDVVGYKNFGSYTVIEYDSVGPFSTSCAGSSLKFEVILYANGKIKMQYNNIVYNASSTCDSSQTIGIQSNGTAGSAALSYACNGAGPQPANGRAVWFYQLPGFIHDYACQGVSSPTGSIPPSGTATVTFTAYNPGQTTEASPVKYRFNGGAVVTENTASLPQYGSEVHTFTTQITVPGTVGDYPLLVWTDVPGDGDHSNDTCHVTVQVRECYDFTINAPGTANGNTVGAGDDCSLRTGLDQTVRVVIPHDGSWTFALCGGDPSWDTYMYLSSTCCGTAIAFDDDACDVAALASRISCQVLTAGTYYVDIEPFGSASGTWVLTVSECVPCVITQQGGDIVEAAENPADTTFYRTDPDGGCNSSPAAFGSISCGQTVFGRLFTYTGPGGSALADSDWYAINAAIPESLVVDMYSEVPVRFGIVKYGNAADCDTSLLFIASLTTTDTCTHYVLASPECRAAGRYALLVLPTVTTGITTPREYRMSLSCTPCTPPAPPTNDDCATATPITVAHNDSTVVLGSTNLANITCTDTCDYTSAAKDVFYSLTVSGCRLIEMKLEASLNATSGDMHISVYPAGQCCTSPALLCDDDWANFDTLGMPWAQHHGSYSLSSWVVDSLTTGTYIIRVSYFSTGSGPYRLAIFDDGGCSAVCDSALDVTALRVDPVRGDSCVEIRYTAPVAGQYEIWSTADKNSDFTPGGVWTLEITQTVPAANNAWRDPAVLQPFKRYVVRHVCP